LDEKSGKTIVALAIAKLANKKVGYIKPIGNNVIYKDKKVLDYDAILFKELFSMEENAEDLCLGMHHSKILHFYPDAYKEFIKRYDKISHNKDLVLIEGGEFLWKGASINLDVITVCKKINAEVIFVISGDYYELLDKLYYIEKIKDKMQIKGVVLNNVSQEDVNKIREDAKKFGMPFLGFISHIQRLRATRVDHIVKKLFAKVVAGENGLDKYVENVFIAALAASEIKRHPDFKKENKLIITGGDRSDVITACLQKGTSGIVLTNNIIPSSNILAIANEKNIPLISLRPDTYTVVKLIENIQPIILADEKKKLAAIEKEAGQHLNIDEIIKK
jgi:BioD-like phosphotransacetylase family protein